MNPPKVVVFDLGKVLLDFDYTITARKIFARCRVPAHDIVKLINQSPLLLRYESGALTTEEFFAEIKSAAGFSGDLDEFSELFGNIFSPIEPMIELHATLRGRSIPTFIFSNTNELAVRDIRARFPFFQNFDGYVFSYEHGSMKPEAKLYQAVERVTGRRESEILYLDDRPENVAAGVARGWRAVLHETPDQSKAEVSQAGLL
ncbi:MAG: HAD family phosphatase [Verrucomicrobia bacterium]|nr:HAD family phosphatase [Verrucomicrobiota bacterium]